MNLGGIELSQESEFSSDELMLVTFTLGQETFGLDIMNVQEVIRMPSLTRVPRAPVYVDGMTNLRGRVLPVIDARTKFGMEMAETGDSQRVIVIDAGGTAAGLNVDSVSEVLRVDKQYIEPAPASILNEMGKTHIRGVVRINDAQKLVMILDVASLFEQEIISGSSLQRIRSEVEDSGAVINEMQLVSFLVGTEEFGLDIGIVKEIIRPPDIVKFPNVPEYIKGIISLRDTLMPVVDLRTKLNVGTDEITERTRVVVVDITGSRIGLIVDRVFEVIRVPKVIIFSPPPMIHSDCDEKITGIIRMDDGKRIIMLIDPQNIINHQDLQEITSQNKSAKSEYDQSSLQNMEEEQLVVFTLAGEQFGVRIAQVQEITKLSQITKVPQTLKFVQGVVNLRGDVIPLIDLRKRFEIETHGYTDRTRIIVSDVTDKKVGIIVDEVLEVLRIPNNRLEVVPGLLNESQTGAYMEGIVNLGDRTIISLNLENVLAEEEWKLLNEIEAPLPRVKKTSSRLKKQPHN